MSHLQFHFSSRVDLYMHGLNFETSICYWQDQPGCSHPIPHARYEHRAARSDSQNGLFKDMNEDTNGSSTSRNIVDGRSFTLLTAVVAQVGDNRWRTGSDQLRKNCSKQ